MSNSSNPIINRVLQSGIAVATDDGIAAVTVKAVARLAGVSRQTIHSYFTSAASMRESVFRECIKRKVLCVVAQLIVTKHPIANEIPGPVRRDAIKSLQS